MHRDHLSRRSSQGHFTPRGATETANPLFFLFNQETDHYRAIASPSFAADAVLTTTLNQESVPPPKMEPLMKAPSSVPLSLSPSLLPSSFFRLEPESPRKKREIKSLTAGR